MHRAELAKHCLVHPWCYDFSWIGTERQILVTTNLLTIYFLKVDEIRCSSMNTFNFKRSQKNNFSLKSICKINIEYPKQWVDWN